MLITKQGARNRVSVCNHTEHLELYGDIGGQFKYVPDESPIEVSIEISAMDVSLHYDQFRKAATLSSKFAQPRLHYRMLLEAYRAHKNEDYRKAIIEAATALEICLTERILSEFDCQEISFGERLLQKFRMLGGRFELAKLIDINLPDKDYSKLVMNPRNDVIHRASFPNKQIANQVINEVEILLKQFSPQLSEEG